MSTWPALAVAVTFVWLGMVFAISFIEAPLKFRAPGITIPLGLGIGRLVFRALNAVEVALAVALVVAVAFATWSGSAIPVATGVGVAALAVQVLAVRPKLTKRTDAVLAGGDSSHRSNVHFVYVGFEVVKVIALLTVGIAVLV